jgi:hypothetical protein
VVGQRRRECATVPLGRQRGVLARVLIDEAVEVLCEFTPHFVRSPGTWAVQQALRSLLGKTLPPWAPSSMRQGAERGDGGDVLTHDHCTDGLRPAQDPHLRGLLEHGGSGRQCMSGTVAFEGAHRLAPWRLRTFISHMLCGDALLSGTKWLRLQFSRFCS